MSRPPSPRLALRVLTQRGALGLLLAFPLVATRPAAAWQRDQSLARAGASFVSEDSNGSTVEGAGDVDGDGFDDLLIAGGAHGDGLIYLILGRDSAWSTEVPLESSDASFQAEVRDESYETLAKVGDVNGDALGDFLIGASYNDAGGQRAGQVYLVLGQTDDWRLGTRLENVDASFIGENAFDNLGQGIGGGDVDGDGLDDLLFGAPSNQDGGTDAGKVYLVLGRSSAWNMDMPAGSADATFTGEAEHRAGGALTMDGDFNGDGYHDIAIDSSHARGAVYVFYGRAGAWEADTPLTSADASFSGEGGGIRGLASAGDVDGDGNDDLLVGSATGDGAGQACLVLGRGAGWSGVSPLSIADATFLGEEAYDELGTSLDGAGDVDGDGQDDLILGAPNNDSHSAYSGKAYLIQGRTSGWGMDDVGTSADASFYSDGGASSVGFSVAGAGDVDGDGLDEFLIGGNEKAYLLTEDPDCEDQDHDGSGAAPCGDCNDGDASTHPGATEVLADGIDQDCDGGDTCYADADGDGHRTSATVLSADADCTDPGEAGPDAPSGDCDDAQPAAFPGAVEVCDGIDNDCDGTIDGLVSADIARWYPDADADGFTTGGDPVAACDSPDGYAAASDATDCNDQNPSVHPGAEEVPGDGIDQDCDGVDPTDPTDTGVGAKDDCGCSTPGGGPRTPWPLTFLAPLVIQRRRPRRP